MSNLEKKYHNSNHEMPGRRCPFISNPFEECFIANINSQNIDEAINYCGNNFEDCEIYRSLDKQGLRRDVK